MAGMHNPAYPGEILKEDVLPGLGLTVTDAARQLGVSRVALSRVLNGRASLSADMAIRIGQWLDQSPESWLRMQVAYDLWQAGRRRRVKVAPARAAA